jgi:hypothetical protein
MTALFRDIKLKENKILLFVRWALIFLVFVRSVQIVISYFIFSDSVYFEDWFFCGLYLTTLLLFGLGYKINIFGLLLFYLGFKFDSYFMCQTVGTNVSCLLFLFFGLRDWSIKKDHAQHETIYKYLSMLLLLVFLAISFQSSLIHLQDPYWLNGNALIGVFTTPYLSPSIAFSELVAEKNWLQNVIKYGTWSIVFFQLTAFFWVGLNKIWVLIFFWFIPYSIVLLLVENLYLKYQFILFLVLIGFGLRKGFEIDEWKRVFKHFYYKKIFKYLFIILSVYLWTAKPINGFGLNKLFWIAREWDTYIFIKQKFNSIGLKEFDLFNAYQVEGGNRYFVLYRKEKNDNIYKRLPFFHDNGRVDKYNKIQLPLIDNHNSDFLYLGMSFQGLIGNDTFTYHNSFTPDKFKGNFYQRMAQYDYNKNNFNDTVDYRVYFYNRSEPYLNGVVNPNLKFELRDSISFEHFKPNI